jgi:cysteinyl-tRNA synthetase
MKIRIVFLFLLVVRIVSAQPAPASFAYVLQAESLGTSKPAAVEQLAGCGRDWLVLDAMFSSDTAWDKMDVQKMRNRKPGRKVIAYISIGEAEDYRSYWRKEWASKGKLTKAAPTWLDVENPEWKGNYRVKYWRPEWQKLILDAVDETMARGFDGVYLDIVDAFETFEREGRNYIDDRINPETGQSFRRNMVDWVKALAARARSSNPAVLVIPQNGSQLLAQTDFVAVVSAIGIEDLFTNGKKLQSKSHARQVLDDLKKISAASKPMLLVEYCQTPERQALSKKLSNENGMTWLITDRQLKTLGVSGN